jgi:hypothetical protein
MSNLYKSSVTDHCFTREGLSYFVQHGEPLSVDSELMVRLTGGVIVPARGWHAEFSDAVLEAAQRIEALGHRLLSQADRLRVEAAASAKPEVTT